MNSLILDGEWTIGNWKKGMGGNPFDPRNRLCVVGAQYRSEGLELPPVCFKIEYDSTPYGDSLRALQALVDIADELILFNAKTDLHWLRRYGIKFQHKKIWDIQVAHFVMLGQSTPWPSLNDVCAYYDLGQKSEVIEKEYWSKHIDTDLVPYDTLVDYNYLDLRLSGKAYSCQKERLKDKPEMHRKIVLDCIDTLILEEMEWNGILFDSKLSLQLASTVRGTISDLDLRLQVFLEGRSINWNSGDQVSAVLYGGRVAFKSRAADGFFKTGKRAGQVRYKLVIEEVEFPKLVSPLEGSQLDKEGFYSTAEPVLRQLKPKGKAKEIIEILLERAKLEKLVSSYYEGIPKQIAEFGWENNTIHGNLNQCVAATGRLSSSKPNLQNNPPQLNTLFMSRYE